MKKNKILKFILVLVGLASISVGLFFVFKKTGITDIDRLRAIISKAGIWAPIIYILIRIPLTILLCFVPACSMIFDLLAVALFGATLKAFIISIASVFACSTIMYILGRTGANKLLEKIVGKEDLEKANKLIKEKGLVFYPVMMAVGGFPDDALVCMAGVTKMNFIYFVISTVVGRGIGCAFSVFGIALIPFDTFKNIYDWISFACNLIVIAFVVIKVGNWLNNKINTLAESKKKKQIKISQIDLEKLEEHRECESSNDGSEK